MMKLYRNYDLPDVIQAAKSLLDQAAYSPEVRFVATEIVANQPDPLIAIYNWVKGNVSYIEDPVKAGGEHIELFISPVRMVKRYQDGLHLSEDCDGQALLVTAFARSIGIRTDWLILDTTGHGFDHAASEAHYQSRRVIIDTTPLPDGRRLPVGWHWEKGVHYFNKVTVS